MILAFEAITVYRNIISYTVQFVPLIVIVVNKLPQSVKRQLYCCTLLTSTPDKSKVFKLLQLLETYQNHVHLNLLNLCLSSQQT